VPRFWNNLAANPGHLSWAAFSGGRPAERPQISDPPAQALTRLWDNKKLRAPSAAPHMVRRDARVSLLRRSTPRSLEAISSGTRHPKTQG